MIRSVPKLVALLAACAVTSVAHGTVWLYPQDGTLDELGDLAADGDTIIMTANADNDRFRFQGMSERNVLVEANGHSIASSSTPINVNSNDRVIVRNAVLEEQPTFPNPTRVFLATICAWSEDIDLSSMVVGDWIDGGEVLLTYGDCESPIVTSCLADLDKSGSVGFNDLTILLDAWGACQ